MAKNLNTVLAELGYESWPSQYPNKTRIFKGEKLIDSMSDGECWNYLRHQHPEYFGEELDKSIGKTTSEMLADLGYSTEKAPYQGRKTILKDGVKIADMTAFDATNYLKRQHPEYFGEAAND